VASPVKLPGSKSAAKAWLDVLSFELRLGYVGF
jgi:hypothetical protein